MRIFKIEVNEKDIKNYTFYIDDDQPTKPYGLLDDVGNLIALGNMEKMDLKTVLQKIAALKSVDNVWELIDGSYIQQFLW